MDQMNAASVSGSRNEEVDMEIASNDMNDFSTKGKEPDRGLDSFSHHIRLVESLIATVPKDVKDCLISNVSSMVAYILDTMEHAPMEMKLPEGPDVIERIKSQSCLEPEDDGLQNASNVNSQVVGAYSFDSTKHARIYSVVLWNDEKHSFKEVIDTVSGATEKTEHVAKNIAERVDKHGRDIIETSGEVKKLYLLAHKLSQIDLAVTIRPAYDIFAEEIAGHVLEFLVDLTNASIFVPPTTTPALSFSTHPHDQLVPNATAMRALIGRALFEPWHHRKPILRGQMSLEYFDNRSLLQLDGLLLMDNRMWKSARVSCRSIYMALLGPREVKRALANRFARMYAKLIEIFIVHDREPEHSVRAVTVQLFSVPSIATELVAELDFLYTLMQILQSIFTGQLTPQALTLPPVAPPKMKASPSSLFLRQTRCYHSFYDMRYLLAAQGVQTQLIQQSRHLAYFLDFLSLFNAIAPDRRAIVEHVEFESEVWMQVLHVATHLSKSAKLFGEAFAKATSKEFIQGVNLILSKTLQSCSMLHQNDPEAHAPIAFDSVYFAEQYHQVIIFAVETLAVSFHHPMHWLLAEMLKNLDVVDFATLSHDQSPLLRNLVIDNIGDNGLLVIFEFPLRVVVKLAQIRSGMWVRNGFGIRSQAHHYRDNSMRDLMYDQDFYLLQTSLAFVPHDRMLVTMIHRFSLLDWLQGRTVGHILEETQYLSMAEEFFLLLVHMFSEVSIATKWNMERQVRREIIHFLALNQGTYSELTRHISERLKEHSSFDRVLASLSSFRAPDGTHDLGIFELKDEFYEEVQPYFFHYSRNQREKAEQVLSERHKKKYGTSAVESFVAVPARVLQSGQGMVVDELRNVFRSPVLHQIIFYGLYNAEYRLKESSENLVDGALQLIMMGLVEQGADFANDMQQIIISHFSILTFLLLKRQDHEKFAGFRAKINWIVRIAAELSEGCRSKVLEMDRNQSKGKDANNIEMSVEEKKRAAAKARQAAIMQQFSAQQKSVLESLEGEEEEEDDDYEEEEGEDYLTMEMSDDGLEEQPLRSFGACIFCQENLDHHKAFGNLAHIQSSRVMRTTPRHDAYSLQQSLQVPLTLDRNDANGKRIRGDTILPNPSQRKWDGFPSEDHRFGFYASTCGHLMHLSCFDNYCRSIEQRHAQQIARNHPEDLSKSEFVCPLCKSLGNIILPVPKIYLQQGTGPYSIDQTPISDWIRKINIDILKTSTMSQTIQLQENEHGTGSFLPWYAEDAQVLLDASVSDPARSTPVIPASTRLMLERFIRVLRPMSNKSRGMRQAYQTRTIHAPPSRKMYMPEELVAYTIAILEISQRGSTPIQKDEDAAHSTGPLHVADGVSIHTRELVQSLILSLRDIAKLDKENYQSLMRHGLLMRLLPHWGGHEPVRSPLLLRDPMTILVEASIIAPENLHHITILMFYIQLIQVVFGLAQPSIWPQSNHAHLSRSTNSPLGNTWKGMASSNTTSPSSASASISATLESQGVSKSDMETLNECFDDVRTTVGNIIGLVGYARGNITLGVDNLDDVSLAKIICTYCLPFLRRATILQKCMGALEEKSSSDIDSNMANIDSTMSNIDGQGATTEKGEFIRLMKLLDIPMPKEALPAQSTRQTAIAGLVEGWIKHAYPQLASIFRPLPIQPSPLSSLSSKNSAGHHPTLQLEHPHIYELINLPSDLTKLLMQCQLLRCKKCGNSPPEPAICLECGELLCFQSFCCQGQLDDKGECNRHVEECGHSSGLFFKVKSNIITLLFQGNGCFTYSPYLDAHGEVDIGLKKGKIQFLHMIRFDELRKQWLNHGLANIITRKIEAVSHICHFLYRVYTKCDWKTTYHCRLHFNFCRCSIKVAG